MKSGWFRRRLQELLSKMFKLTFITWLAIFVVYIVQSRQFDGWFFTFTMAVIGMGYTKDILKGGQDANNQGDAGSV